MQPADGACSQPTADGLWRVFSAYCDVCDDADATRRRERLASLLAASVAAGYCGDAVFALLQASAADIQDISDTRQFERLYRFVFFVGRRPGHKNLLLDGAVSAWRLLLGGRFRLLDRFLAFVAASSRPSITEDTWRQVLDFSRLVYEDLSNYDPNGAWPVLVDEFVESVTAAHPHYRPHYQPSVGGNSSGGSGGGSGSGSGGGAGSPGRGGYAQLVLSAPGVKRRGAAVSRGGDEADVGAVTLRLAALAAPASKRACVAVAGSREQRRPAVAPAGATESGDAGAAVGAVGGDDGAVAPMAVVPDLSQAGPSSAGGLHLLLQPAAPSG